MRISLSLLFAAMTLLAGCAVVQKPIPASSKLFDDRNTTVAVAVDTMPQPGMRMTGAQGVLDYAINKANAAAIEERLKSQDFSMVTGLREELSKGLASRQVKFVVLKDPVDSAKLPKYTEGSGEGIAVHDYRGLAKQYGADRLLLISPRWLGTTRNYYGFMPLGAPQGYVALVGQMVDLRTNRLEWYDITEVSTAVKGDWDQAPQYDNLMNSVTESTRQATNQLRASLFLENMSAATDAALQTTPAVAIQQNPAAAPR